MKPVTRNLLANYIGRGWALIINLIAAPLLIKLLGIESYGLIGFYTTLYGLINVLDFGISPTINRELAQYSVDDAMRFRGRDLVRTLEVGYWIIGVFLGIIVYFGAPLIAKYWLQSSQLSIDALIRSIRLMGFLVVLEWPITFYQGALLGLQKHVLLNIITIMNGLLKYGGALIILTFFSPTVDSFFSWQILISTLVIFFLVFTVWRSLPAANGKPVFDFQLLERIWKFALSMNMISFLGLIIHQLDKILVSHLFSLEIFGYYNLATMVANGFTTLVSPIFVTYFPRLSTLVAQKDEITLRRIYHQSCQLVSVAILPATTIGVLFSQKIITVWTGDPYVAQQSYLIAAILIIGTALNSLASIPYQTQVAYGWTSLGLITNIISLPVIVALIFLMNQWFGIVGVSGIWVIYNFLLVAITIPIMHRKILHGECRTWLIHDIVVPLVVCLLFFWIVMSLQRIGFNILDSIPALLCFAVVIQSCVTFVVPFTREKSLQFLKNLAGN